MSNGLLCSSCGSRSDSSAARRAAMQFLVSKPRMFFGNESWGNVLHGGNVLQTPAAGGDCSGDGSAAGSRTVVGTGASRDYAWWREAPRDADALVNLERFEEAKSLLRRTRPVARRVLGESNVITLKLLWVHAQTLYKDDSATLADLRGLVNTLEDSARVACRVYGRTHPVVAGTQYHLGQSRAALAARETLSPGR